MKMFILLMGIQVAVMAQSNYADSFLRIGTSARTISLGQAVVAMHGHPQSYLIILRVLLYQKNLYFLF